MKPCSKTRSEKSTCANIFLQLPWTILFRHYLGINATSCYWSYIDFYRLISHNYILTHTYSTAAGAEFIRSLRDVLKNFVNFTRKHLCCSLVFTKLQVFRAATLQVFSCEIWEILKNTYFEEHLNHCFCVLITSWYIDFYSTRFSFLQISSSSLRN